MRKANIPIFDSLILNSDALAFELGCSRLHYVSKYVCLLGCMEDALGFELSDGAQPHLVNIHFQKKVKLQIVHMSRSEHVVVDDAGEDDGTEKKKKKKKGAQDEASEYDLVAADAGEDDGTKKKKKKKKRSIDII
ncbi:anaphase-promoting complex subunit 10 isoform X1 [Tanacetum coccineum]